MRAEWLMYDGITRVPMIVKDFRSQHETRSTDSLVSLMDVGPTALDFANLPIPTRLEGKSIRPLLDEKSDELHEAVYCEDNYMVMRRTKTHKTIHYIGQAEGEFYDLINDPTESKNLWNLPAHQELRNRERFKLLDWLATSAYFNGGHKTGSADKDGRYPIRWHSDGDHGIHGDNYRPINSPH